MAKTTEEIQGRLAAFGIVLVIAFALILGRLWFLQVLAGGEYGRLAEGNRVRAIALEAPRGVIYDREGRVLVDNRPGLAVTAVADEMTRRPEVIASLARLLKLSKREIKDRLREAVADPLKPRVIEEDVDGKTIATIEEHNASFPGVDVEVRSIRDYPMEKLAAHVLGYVGEINETELQKGKSSKYVMGDLVGKSGVEREYETVLRGVKGLQQIEVEASGRPLRVLSTTEPVPGQNLKLTIDADIQKWTEAALARAVRDARRSGLPAPAGAAVVIDPRNGEVLGMASYPSYDPRVFIGRLSKKEWKALSDKDSHYPLTNRAVMGAYPAASTFKIVTGAGALADGITTPSTRFYDPGRWTKMGKQWVKFCWKRSGHGTIDFVTGIVQSCDTVFYELGLTYYRQGKERLQLWARRFGFGSKTGIDLPAELKGRVPGKAWKKWWNRRDPAFQKWMPGDNVNLAIGQGDFLATPLQVAVAYSVIATGGRLYKPHLAKAVLSRDGRVVRTIKPELVRRVPFKKSHLAALRAGLRGVVTLGTAQAAFNGFPVAVSGKTGTAQVATKEDFAWFVGLAPADKPRYLAVVIIEEGGHGGATAAPVVREIFSRIFKVPVELPKVVDESR